MYRIDLGVPRLACVVLSSSFIYVVFGGAAIRGSATVVRGEVQESLILFRKYELILWIYLQFTRENTSQYFRKSIDISYTSVGSGLQKAPSPLYFSGARTGISRGVLACYRYSPKLVLYRPYSGPGSISKL